MNRASNAAAVPPEAQAEAVSPVRAHTISKLGGTAGGRITYAVGVDPAGTVHLAVTANEGGGYFSPEWVPLPRVRACLAANSGAGEAFPTRVLRGAYRNRSVNNGGFLAAVLRHEGLLRAGALPHLHRCEDGWDAWEAAQRASAVAVAALEPDAGPAPAGPVDAKAGARGRRKGQRPTGAEGVSDADA